MHLPRPPATPRPAPPRPPQRLPSGTEPPGPAPVQVKLFVGMLAVVITLCVCIMTVVAQEVKTVEVASKTVLIRLPNTSTT